MSECVFGCVCVKGPLCPGRHFVKTGDGEQTGAGRRVRQVNSETEEFLERKKHRRCSTQVGTYGCCAVDVMLLC